MNKDRPRTPPTLSVFLQRRLVLWLVLLTVVSLAFACAFSYVLQKRNFEERSARITTLLANQINTYIALADESLREMALRLPRTPDADLLRSLAASDPHALDLFARIMVLDADGIVVASIPGGPVQVDFPLRQPRGHDSASPIIGKPVPLSDTGEVVVWIGTDLWTQGRLLGALRLDALGSSTQALLPEESEVIILADRFGNLIAHPDPAEVQRQGNIGNLPFFNAERPVTRGTLSLEGAQWVVTASTLAPHNWKILTLKRQTTLLGEVAGGIGIMAVLLLLLYALFAFKLLAEMRKRIGEPLEAFATSLKQVAQGEYRPSSRHSHDFVELETMHEEFGLMAERVRLREADLKRERAFISDVVDAIPSALFALDGEGRVVLMNAAAEGRTGVPSGDAQCRHITEILPTIAPIHDEIVESIASERLLRMERHTSQRDGRTRYEDIALFPVSHSTTGCAVLRIDDVTARVHMEELMVQTEKMMSVGGLAAGMAHEINNPLGAILLGAQNISRRLDPAMPANIMAAEHVGCKLDTINAYLAERRIPAFLEGIREAGIRAASIVANMLEFSRRGETHHSTVDLRDALDRTVALAASDYDLKKKYDFRHINIIRDYDATLPPVVCSATEIEQVILNLLRNAAQALAEQGPDAPPPHIILRTSQQKDMACIEVEDNGPGMTAEVRKRVFEPFFTTKNVGVGTGLGLSVSYFIVTRNHRGTFDVESTPGQGTRFSIRLPFRNAAALAAGNGADTDMDPGKDAGER